MKKFALFLICLCLNVLILKNIDTSKTEMGRLPSSKISKITQSCFKSIKAFFVRPAINENLYSIYLEKYKFDLPIEKKEFEAVEDFAAWIDSKVTVEGFSVARNYLTPGVLAKIKSTKLNLSRPDHFLSYFFESTLDNIIKESVKIEGLDSIKLIFLKSILMQKLTNEALLNYHGPKQSISLWSKIKKSNITKNLERAISFTPVAFGFPPLRLPGIKSKSQMQILDSRSLDEALKAYSELSTFKKSSLALKISYDNFKKYYVLGVAAYYFYFTYLDFEKIEDDEQYLSELNLELDDATEKLSELISPSCQSVINCLEEYRSEWSNENDNLYYEYKSTCKEVYSVEEDC